MLLTSNRSQNQHPQSTHMHTYQRKTHHFNVFQNQSWLRHFIEIWPLLLKGIELFSVKNRLAEDEDRKYNRATGDCYFMVLPHAVLRWP